MMQRLGDNREDPQSWVVRPLQAAEVSLAAGALAEAFRDDLMFRYFFRAAQGSVDPERIRAVMEGIVQLGSEFGHVYCADPAEGAVVALPPGVIDFPVHRMAPLILRRLPRTGLGYVRRILPVSNELNTKRPKEPHWYVLLVGVAPTLQGQGLGKCLMRRVLALAQAQAQTVYLETTAYDNLRFYARLGFRTQEQFHCHRGRGPLVWSMLKPGVGSE